MRAASGGEQAAGAGGVDKSAAGEKEEKGCISVSAGCNWVAFRPGAVDLEIHIGVRD